MDKTSTPSISLSPKSSSRNRRSAGPSVQALNFIRQFARAYRVEAGFGLVIN